MRQKELFFPLTKISPLKPRLLYDNSIATDDSYPAHFQKPPQTSTLPAMRLRMFFQSYNNKFGEPNHPADAMKKAKEKREVLIRVASESLSAQLAGANSDATRFSVHREGNFSGRFECRGSGFDVRWSPNNSLKRTGVTIHMLSTSTRPSLSCIRSATPRVSSNECLWQRTATSGDGAA